MFSSKSTNIILAILALIVLVAVGYRIYWQSHQDILNPESTTFLLNNMPEENIVRPAAVAGAFYPADPTELSKTIDQFLSNVSVQTTSDNLRVLIVPHAGYEYSGQVAANAFKQLVGADVEKVILIGPSHNFPASGLVLSSATQWQTPLGSIQISPVNQQLALEKNFSINDAVHEPEHSLEVEIPFIQKALPQAQIIPIIVGQLNAGQQLAFTETLKRYLDEKTILVVSVDLSHYHDYQTAVSLDTKSTQHILNLQPEEVLSDEIDAPWAVASVLTLAKQNNWRGQLLTYANSGDVTGDKSAVVGYSAIGFYGPAIESAENENYTLQEKQELLAVARQVIEIYLNTGEIYQPQTDNPKFKEPRGVFVTLNKDHRLRGCIGYIEPIKSLIEAVRDNAISAAVEDPRFSPVGPEELADIEIEISILTLPKPDTLQNIVKYKLGTVLRQGNKGVTYLPQVWNDFAQPEEFFTSLCQKAGLTNDCWQESQTAFSSYQAIVFSESD